MKKMTQVFLAITIIITSIFAWFGYTKMFRKKGAPFFTTQQAGTRDIINIMHAEGIIEAQKTSKLGPLITATVKHVHIKEGQNVTKNTLLAELENDKGGDTDVRLTKAQLEQAQSNLNVVTANYKREKALYAIKALSQEGFEKVHDGYLKAQAEVAIKQAMYDKERFLFEQTKIYAPHDGTITAIGVERGETISPVASPPKVLFEIAQDLTKMKATLYIDENKIGDIKKGMTTEITVDPYPYRQPWTGTIDTITLSKYDPPAGSTQQARMYKAEVLVDNHEGLLRPGMTIHTKTILSQATGVLAVPGFVFQLNGKAPEAAAKALGLVFQPIDPAKKQELLKQIGTYPIKTVWVAEPRAIVEKAVEIGVTDNAYFQIVSGVTAADNIIADDMSASEELQKIARQVVG